MTFASAQQLPNFTTVHVLQVLQSQMHGPPCHRSHRQGPARRTIPTWQGLPPWAFSFPPLASRARRAPSSWQRLVTCNRLQRKRVENPAKVQRGETTKTAIDEYMQLLAAQPSTAAACFCLCSAGAAAAAAHSRVTGMPSSRQNAPRRRRRSAARSRPGAPLPPARAIEALGLLCLSGSYICSVQINVLLNTESVANRGC